MTREPAITFRGALQILGHHDHKWLKRLDALLGGVVLTSGATPAIGAVWGWVDQKNEATSLLRHALGAVSDRLTRTGGLARHELVVAAHTTLVLAALFESLRERLGQVYDEAALTKAEKIRLGTEAWQQIEEPLLRHLYRADVPSPSAMRGFEDNVTFVGSWAAEARTRVVKFLAGLGVIKRTVSDRKFADAVQRRYRSDYLTLATTVPEFKVWADLGEHAATRTALAGLAALLTQPGPKPPHRNLRVLLAEINRAELARPVIDVDIEGYGVNAVFPALRDIFLLPHFRSVSADPYSRVGDERWWDEVKPRDDLDVLLARHFSTAGATRTPLLLLGHPGAGKSLLTKVLAAQLPESTYTVVRVPLRRVDADANVSAQIKDALDVTTNNRVSWPELAYQSEETVRVILLDGLDELLQATTNDRAGYLTDIVEFQRIEAAMGKPVAVVVTSRTLVVDRVRVPDGTPVLKLEEFDDDQIREWLRIWHDVNDSTRPITLEDVLAQGDLARQPLLLLMLTLYFADPDTESPSVHLSTAELYERLFETYARREVTKRADRVLSDPELAEAVRGQLLRLSAAALGMFNRGRQFISEGELGADLAALKVPVPAAGRLLGEFFFVHAPEAQACSMRGYEFLHATFGEYLVATRVMEVLTVVAEGSFGRRYSHEPDDALLFALLSHQPLAIQRPILDFLADRTGYLDENELDRISRTLDLLIPVHRHRREDNRHTDYRPLPADVVRASAAYSANLVILRVLVASGNEVALSTLWPGSDARDAWRAMVNLWAAGFDAETYRAVLATIAVTDHVVFLEDDDPADPADISAARLRGDRDVERRLRFGHAVLNEPVSFDSYKPETWEDSALSAMVKLITRGGGGAFTMRAPELVPMETTAAVADVAYGILGLYCMRWSRVSTERFLQWLMTLRAPSMSSPFPLALAEHVHPGVLESLRDSPHDAWTPEWQSLLRAATPDNLQELDISTVVEYLRAVAPGRWSIAGPDEDLL